MACQEQAIPPTANQNEIGDLIRLAEDLFLEYCEYHFGDTCTQQQTSNQENGQQPTTKTKRAKRYYPERAFEFEACRSCVI